MELKTKGFKELEQWLTAKLDKLLANETLLDSIGLMLVRSVHKNFKEGGRPKWKESARAKKQSGQTLRDTGRLVNSIVHEVKPPKVTIGTNVEYAPYLHYGSTKKVPVKAHKRKTKTGLMADVKQHERKYNITARPFLVLHETDYNLIKKRVIRFLETGK